MVTTQNPQHQEFHIEGVQHVSPQEAFRMLKNQEAMLLDIREEDETALQRVDMPDVLYHPLSSILDRIKYIPRDTTIITACPAGIRSTRVANLLKVQGFSQVVNLDGGLHQWQQMNLPFIDTLPASGCCSDDSNGGCCSSPKEEKVKINIKSSGCGCSAEGCC
jgi:rhodanese-related sulfurtransferase